jgi:hypothetical protein
MRIISVLNPEIVGKKYLVIGTLDRADWKRIDQIDILPMGKPRGLPPSRVGFPASRRRARFGFHRTWSYSLSTGRHRKPCGQHIFSSIDITVMLNAALGTCPGTDIKRQGVKQGNLIVDHTESRNRNLA